MNFGLIKTQVIPDQNISADTVALVLNSFIHTIELCKVKHLTPDGEWVVAIANQTSDIRTLYEKESLCCLIIERPAGDNRVVSHPVKYGEWKKALKNNWINEEEPQYFELIPRKFKTGLYDRSCVACGGYFLGALSQGHCRGCCDRESEAKLIINPDISSKERKRLMSIADAKKMAERAYDAGFTDISSNFEDWYNRYY
jgi:hypothetical protein